MQEPEAHLPEELAHLAVEHQAELEHLVQVEDFSTDHHHHSQLSRGPREWICQDFPHQMEPR